jgi:hypothetical protein
VAQRGSAQRWREAKENHGDVGILEESHHFSGKLKELRL